MGNDADWLAGEEEDDDNDLSLRETQAIDELCRERR